MVAIGYKRNNNISQYVSITILITQQVFKKIVQLNRFLLLLTLKILVPLRMVKKNLTPLENYFLLFLDMKIIF